MTITLTGIGVHNAASGASPASINTTAALAVGDALLVVMGYDNSGGGGSDPMTAGPTITPATGTWATLSTQTGLNDPGAASAGLAARAVLLGLTAGSLASGAAVSIAWTGTVVVRSIQLVKVSTGTATPIAFVGNSGATGTNQVATAAPALTTATVNNGDTVICWVAHENGANITGDADTTNGSWSAIITTFTGSGNTGMAVGVQRKTVTATATQDFNPTGTLADWILGAIRVNEVIAPVTVTAQIANLALSELAGSITTGAVDVVAQPDDLILTALAGTVTTGEVTVVAQEATLTLTPVAITPATDAPPFSPDDIPNLRAWWDADNYSGSGTVWPDASGNGLSLTLVGSPPWSTGANGHKQFEIRAAAASYATMNSNALLNFALTDSFTVIAFVHQFPSMTGGAFILAKRSNAGTAPGYSLGLNTAAPNTVLRSRVSSNAENCQVNSAILPTGVPLLLGVARDVVADEVQGWVDNTKTTTVDTTTLTSSNSTAFRIGTQSNTTNNQPEMDIRAVLVYAQVLTATDIANLVDYFNEAAGPSTQTVTAQVATLTLTAIPITPTTDGPAATTVTAQIATLTLTALAGVETVGEVTVTAQIANLALTEITGTVTVGPTTLVAQVAALALTPISVTPSTAPPPTTTVAQIANLALSELQGTVTVGSVTVAAQIANLALSELQGTLTTGPVTVTAQIANLALSELAGTKTTGAVTIVAQIAQIALTEIQGSISVVGGSGQTVIAQVALLSLVEVPGVATVSPLVTAQIASLSLTELPGAVTVGPVTVVAQLATLALTGRPGTVSIGAVTLAAQIAVLTLSGVTVRPGGGEGIAAASAIYVGTLPATKVYAGTVQVWP